MLKPSKSKKSLDEIIKLMIENKLATIYTSLPARVLKFYPETMRADVQPLLKTIDINGVAQDSSPTTNVPIIYPNAGDLYIRTPLEPGDLVLVQYSTVALDDILETNLPVKNTLKRRFSQKDGFVVGGYRFDKGAETLSGGAKDLVIHRRSTDTIIKLDASGNINISGANSISVEAKSASLEAPNVSVNASNINITASQTAINGNVTVSGSLQAGSMVTSGGINLDEHTHNYNPGPGAPTATTSPN